MWPRQEEPGATLVVREDDSSMTNPARQIAYVGNLLSDKYIIHWNVEVPYSSTVRVTGLSK